MSRKNSVVRPRDRARPSFNRSILAFGVAAPTAGAVSACGGGSSGSGSSVEDGFTRASQPADPFTVWVDSTRVRMACRRWPHLRQVRREGRHRSVHAALDAGITFFDVAPYYGLTAAETVLGRALRGIDRDRYVLYVHGAIVPVDGGWLGR